MTRTPMVWGEAETRAYDSGCRILKDRAARNLETGFEMLLALMPVSKCPRIVAYRCFWDVARDNPDTCRTIHLFRGTDGSSRRLILVPAADPRVCIGDDAP